MYEYVSFLGSVDMILFLPSLQTIEIRFTLIFATQVTCPHKPRRCTMLANAVNMVDVFVD